MAYNGICQIMHRRERVSAYAVLSFFGVKINSSSSSGGQRFFLGDMPRLVYKSDIVKTRNCLACVVGNASGRKKSEDVGCRW